MWWMRHSDADRGAAAVIVALSLAVLIGALGVAVDIGAGFSEKQKLQNAADAAALAVARECLNEGVSSHCPNDSSVAGLYAAANAEDYDGASVDYPESYYVSVAAEEERDNWFLPVLSGDLKTMELGASATVNFGSPVSGTATLPIAVAECLFPGGATGPGYGTTIEVWAPKNANKAEDAGCASGTYPSGGFGWLEGPNCTAIISVGDPVVPGDTGNDPAATCKGKPKDYFVKMIESGTTIIIPLFKESTGGGSSGAYRVSKFAAFTITGFESQTGHFKNSNPGCSSKQPGWASKWCFQGTFMQFYDDPGDFDLGGPITDLTFVRLTD